MRQNRHSTKMYVGHHNTLSDSVWIRIVWFQQKQDSDRIQISFFKNRIGSDSKNPLSDHLWYAACVLCCVLVAVLLTLLFSREFEFFLWSCRFFWRLAGCLFLGLFQLKFACFLQISVLRIAFFSNFTALLLFQCTARGILGVFLWNFSQLGLFFRFASLLFYLIFLLIFRFIEFSCQRLLGLFFS